MFTILHVASAFAADAVIWGGGAHGSDGARVWLERFLAERADIDPFVVPGDGFPRIVDSGSVPGLTPGFDVVLLGLCPDGRGTAVRDVLRAFSDGVYVRPVRVPADPRACPTLRDDAVVLDHHTVTRGAQTLTVTELGVTRDDGTDGGENARGATRSVVLAVLRAGERRAFDRSLQGDTTDPGFGTSCVTDLSEGPDGAVTVETVCAWRTVECGTPTVRRVTTVGIRDGGLEIRSTDERMASLFCIQ
jgi:hypothetical protein